MVFFLPETRSLRSFWVDGWRGPGVGVNVGAGWSAACDVWKLKAIAISGPFRVWQLPDVKKMSKQAINLPPQFRPSNNYSNWQQTSSNVAKSTVKSTRTIAGLLLMSAQIRQRNEEGVGACGCAVVCSFEAPVCR
jgi:hypothetical protein